MQKADTNQAVRVHRKTGASTTLNRKYVRRPQHGTEALEEAVQTEGQAQTEVRVQRSPKISRFNDEMDALDMAAAELYGGVGEVVPISRTRTAKPKRSIKVRDEKDFEAERRGREEALAPAETHPLQVVAASRMLERNVATTRPQVSAKEIKEKEIKKALAKSSKAIDKDVTERERREKRTKMHFGIARVMLAVSCAAAAVVAIGYFVGTNMPDISMRVAAMQTGIRASYPGYVPRGFDVSDLSSEDGSVLINFKNDESGDAFSLLEEKSSWDSSALEMNYVKKEYGNDYTILREQGLTIYVAKSGAAWVNGGVMYKLSIKSGELTKKQIRSIAVSL